MKFANDRQRKAVMSKLQKSGKNTGGGLAQVRTRQNAMGVSRINESAKKLFALDKKLTRLEKEENFDEVEYYRTKEELLAESERFRKLSKNMDTLSKSTIVDSDGDGIVNAKDCKPFDASKKLTNL